RDAGGPYRAGPSLRIDAGGKLQAGAKPLADVPTGEWVHVEIVCNLGREAKGTYDLTLTLPGESPHSFQQLPCGSDRFNRLEWLGFVSLAQGDSVFYLDNVKLEVAAAGTD
ncbi:MAG: right-handed parallel beta-helix repeat-containing protein, partial [Planctomycetota bacterium]